MTAVAGQDRSSGRAGTADRLECLSWRIPPGDEEPGGDHRRSLVSALAVTLLVAAVLLFAPASVRDIGLIVVLPLSCLLGFILLRSVRRARRRRQNNVRIDESGVHWMDDFGRWHTFERGQVKGYRIGPDADTLRPLPALMLRVEGGFESQPIELHPPATPDEVRKWLTDRLRITEETLPRPEAARRIRSALAAALESWPPSAEKRLLRRLLPDSVQATDGGWLVFTLPGDRPVVFDAQRFTYRIATSGEVGGLAELLDYVRLQVFRTAPDLGTGLERCIDRDAYQQCFPGEPPPREALVHLLLDAIGPDLAPPLKESELVLRRLPPEGILLSGRLRDAAGWWDIEGEAQWNEQTGRFTGWIDPASEQDTARLRQRESDDARRAGFYACCHELGRRWHVEGDKPALLALCQRIEDAAQSLEPAPPGMRPSMVRLGGEEMRMAVQVGNFAWLDHQTICGPSTYLTRLAERMRDALARCSVPGDTQLRLADDPQDLWSLQLHVREHGFDPADHSDFLEQGTKRD